MRLGFSYVGCVMLVMLFVPNMIWTKNKPIGYEDFVGNENRVLLCLERVGQVAVSVLCLIFADFNIGAPCSWNLRHLWLVFAAVCMILYEAYWVRYFLSKKTMKDYYSSFMGIPVAGATLPVIAFFLLAVYGKNVFLGAAVILLGIGHIGIHLNHQKEIL